MFKNPFLVKSAAHCRQFSFHKILLRSTSSDDAFMKFKTDRFLTNKLLFMLNQCVFKKSLSIAIIH